jgi:hypothetical protein
MMQVAQIVRLLLTVPNVITMIDRQQMISQRNTVIPRCSRLIRYVILDRKYKICKEKSVSDYVIDIFEQFCQNV